MARLRKDLLFTNYYSSAYAFNSNKRKNKDCIDGDLSDNAKSAAVEIDIRFTKSSALFPSTFA